MILGTQNIKIERESGSGDDKTDMRKTKERGNIIVEVQDTTMVTKTTGYVKLDYVYINVNTLNSI